MDIIGKKILVVYDEQICRILITNKNFIIVIDEKLDLKQRQIELNNQLEILEEHYGDYTRKDRSKREKLSS